MLGIGLVGFSATAQVPNPARKMATRVTRTVVKSVLKSKTINPQKIKGADFTGTHSPSGTSYLQRIFSVKNGRSGKRTGWIDIALSEGTNGLQVEQINIRRLNSYLPAKRLVPAKSKKQGMTQGDALKTIESEARQMVKSLYPDRKVLDVSVTIGRDSLFNRSSRVFP